MQGTVCPCKKTSLKTMKLTVGYQEDTHSIAVLITVHFAGS